MATLYISEFATQATDGSGRALERVPAAPSIVDQTIALATTSISSLSFNSMTRFVLLSTDAICSVSVGGTAPVATTGNSRMAAGTERLYGVKGGDKMAAITNT